MVLTTACSRQDSKSAVLIPPRALSRILENVLNIAPTTLVRRALPTYVATIRDTNWQRGWELLVVTLDSSLPGIRVYTMCSLYATSRTMYYFAFYIISKRRILRKILGLVPTYAALYICVS